MQHWIVDDAPDLSAADLNALLPGEGCTPEGTDLGRHVQEFLRDIRNHAYERTRLGVWFPKARAHLVGMLYGGGIFQVQQPGGVLNYGHNLMTVEGITASMETQFHNGTKYYPWRFAPYKNNVSPDESATMATFNATFGEFTNYTAGVRPDWVTAAAGATTPKFIQESTKAAFERSSGTDTTIQGMALVSSATKSATTGVLFTIARLVDSNGDPVSEVLNNAGNTLSVGYKFNLENPS